MKIAGQKNDGAWFRANKAVRLMTVPERGALNALIQTLATGPAAFEALIQMAQELGVEPPASPATYGAWVDKLTANGIPRQIWYGHLTFTTYTRGGSAGAYTYAANYQPLMFAFAKDLRKSVIHYIKGLRQTKDVLNTLPLSEGNPGGLPDGIPNN